MPLLAPIGRSDKDDGKDTIQGYIKTIEKQKNNFETARLLYVAVTRAKKYLHLISGTIEEEKEPASSTFLATLWPVLSEQFTHAAAEDDTTEGEPGLAEFVSTPSKALAANWQLPELPSMVTSKAIDTGAEPVAQEQILFDWAGDTARLIGLVVHRFLSRMADDGLDDWPVQKIEEQHRAISAHLIHLAVPANSWQVVLRR